MRISFSTLMVLWVGCATSKPIDERGSARPRYPCEASVPSTKYKKCGCGPRLGGLLDLLRATRLSEAAESEVYRCTSIEADLQIKPLGELSAGISDCVSEREKRVVTPEVTAVLKQVLADWQARQVDPQSLQVFNDCLADRPPTPIPPPRRADKIQGHIEGPASVWRLERTLSIPVPAGCTIENLSSLSSYVRAQSTWGSGTDQMSYVNTAGRNEVEIRVHSQGCITKVLFWEVSCGGGYINFDYDIPLSCL